MVTAPALGTAYLAAESIGAFKSDAKGQCHAIQVGGKSEAGKADAYPRLGPTCLWDTGAAQSVVCYAGGRVETLEGEPLSYVAPSEKLNPHFVVWGF